MQYDWSEELQGYILGSFYTGYVLMHIPGGLLAQRFGGKWVLIGAQLPTALFTLLTPWVVTAGGAPGLMVLRALMGAFQGGLFPAMATVISSWVPKNERGFLTSLVLTGLPVSLFASTLILCVRRGFDLQLSFSFLVSWVRWPVVFSPAFWCITITIGTQYSTILDRLDWF